MSCVQVRKPSHVAQNMKNSKSHQALTLFEHIERQKLNLIEKDSHNLEWRRHENDKAFKSIEKYLREKSMMTLEQKKSDIELWTRLQRVKENNDGQISAPSASLTRPVSGQQRIKSSLKLKYFFNPQEIPKRRRQ